MRRSRRPRRATFVVALGLTLAVVVGCGGSQGSATSKSGAAGSGQSKGEFTMRLNHTLPIDSIRQKDALLFQRLVEQHTNGRVSVQISPAGQLYKTDPDAISAVRSGAVESAMVTTGDLSSVDPAFLIFELPFFFPNQEASDSFEDGSGGQMVLQSLQKVGLQGLAFIDSGAGIVGTKDHAIHGPADFHGMRIRASAQSKPQLAAFKKLGASPIPLAIPDLAPALERGTANADYTTPTVLASLKLNNVLHYGSYTQQQFFPPVLIVNPQWWQKLPPDVQNGIKAALPEFVKGSRKINRQDAQDGLAKLKTQGYKVNVLSDQERAQFKQFLDPVYQQFTDAIGPEIFRAADQAAGQ